MNPVAEEMMSYYTGNDTDKSEDELEHYGMPRRSGRYPWGSGDNPYQHSMDFLSRVEKLKKTGWTETAENVKKEFGMKLDEYRYEKTWCNYERRAHQVAQAKALMIDTGGNKSEVARRMGVNESTIRSLLDPNREAKMNECQETAKFLKEQVDKKKMIDVGKDVERELGIKRDRLDTALYALQNAGYELYGGRVPQATNPGKHTTELVLCTPGTKHSEIYDHDKVQTIMDYTSLDDGKTFRPNKLMYPASMDSKRLAIRYAEDGGINRDGIVELRRNVPDLSLGDKKYSQVRILVDGTHYIKGMAVYAHDTSDWPDGVDVMFNTNKTKDVAKMDVLKEIKKDPDNPFGATIKPLSQGGQYFYKDKDGKEKLGLINKKSDEGDWSEWKDTLPAQFLSKQSRPLAKKQLDLAKADKMDEFNDICSLENPTIKKYYLKKFADSCDAAAVDLKAAALPGQKYHVIISVPSLKDTEIYAPKYKNGSKLALIRYPHAGTFEIPILTVNNKQPDARKLFGEDLTDAVCINNKVAERLSGADFDGDTVMCIPTHDSQGKVKIVNRPYLDGLIGFDPKVQYATNKRVDKKTGEVTYTDDAGNPVKLIKNPKTGVDISNMEMGKISNLITDMTLAGAGDDELERAVKHSMVVIDAAKHKLDYKRSEAENNIAGLKEKYQAHETASGKIAYGAGTLISKSKSPERVNKRQGSYRINQPDKEWYDPNKPVGAKIWKDADDLYYVKRAKDKTTGVVTIRTADGKKVTYDSNDKEAAAYYYPIKKKDKNGNDVLDSDGYAVFTNKSGDITYKVTKRTQDSTKMAEADDANSLVSAKRHPMELIYADYANSMKALANEARKEFISTGKIKYDKNAKEVYKKEVDSLMSKLNEAEKNHVRERAANRKAASEVASKMEADPTMSKSDIKKARQQAISKYREEVGSVSRRERNIKITDREWEAIQAGAISENQLMQILDNADVDNLRERAMPRSTTNLSQAKVNRIKSMSASHYTIGQIAEKLNLSPSTVSKYLKGAE